MPKFSFVIPIGVVRDDTTFLQKLVQGVVVVSGSWNVVVDVVENLFDAEVALVEGCAAAKAQDSFVGATKLYPLVFVLVDKVRPDGVQNLNVAVSRVVAP